MPINIVFNYLDIFKYNKANCAQYIKKYNCTLNFDVDKVAPVTRPKILAARPLSCTAANGDKPLLTKPRANSAACAKIGAAPVALAAAPANWPPPMLGP